MPSTEHVHTIQINTKTSVAGIKPLTNKLKGLQEQADKTNDSLQNISVDVNVDTSSAEKSLNALVKVVGVLAKSIIALNTTGIESVGSTAGTSTDEVQSLENAVGDMEKTLEGVDGKGLESVGTSAGKANDEVLSLEDSLADIDRTLASIDGDSLESIGDSAAKANDEVQTLNSSTSSLGNTASSLDGSDMLSYLGLGTATYTIIGTSAKKETNKITADLKGYDIDAIDEKTNSALVSMQSVIPAMNAIQTAAGATGDQMNDSMDTIVDFGTYVQALTGSSTLAENAMYDLSKGVKGAFASLDQYGITEDALIDAGWSGQEDDFGGYMNAIATLIPSSETYLDTFNGKIALLGKRFSSAGGQIGRAFLPYIEKLIDWFLELNDKMGNRPIQALLVGFTAFSAVKPLGNFLYSLKSIYDTFKGVTEKASTFISTLKEGGFKKAFKGLTDPCDGLVTCTDKADELKEKTEETEKKKKKSTGVAGDDPCEGVADCEDQVEDLNERASGTSNSTSSQPSGSVSKGNTTKGTKGKTKSSSSKGVGSGSTKSTKKSSKGLSKISSSLSKVGSKTTGVFSKIGGSLTGVLGSMGSVATAATGIGTAVVAGGAVATAGLNALGYSWGDVIEGFKTGDLSNIGSSLNDALTGVVDTLTSMDWGEAFSNVGSAITSFFTSIDWGGLLSGAVEGIGSIGAGLFDSLFGTDIEGLMESFFSGDISYGEYVSQVFEQMSSAVPEALSSLGSTIMSALGSLGSWVWDALSSIDWIGAILAGIGDIAGAVWEEISGALGSVWDSLTGWLPGGDDSSSGDTSTSSSGDASTSTAQIDTTQLQEATATISDVQAQLDAAVQQVNTSVTNMTTTFANAFTAMNTYATTFFTTFNTNLTMINTSITLFNTNLTLASTSMTTLATSTTTASTSMATLVANITMLCTSIMTLIVYVQMIQTVFSTAFVNLAAIVTAGITGVIAVLSSFGTAMVTIMTSAATMAVTAFQGGFTGLSDAVDSEMDGAIASLNSKGAVFIALAGSVGAQAAAAFKAALGIGSPGYIWTMTEDEMAGTVGAVENSYSDLSSAAAGAGSTLASSFMGNNGMNVSTGNMTGGATNTSGIYTPVADLSEASGNVVKANDQSGSGNGQNTINHTWNISGEFDSEQRVDQLVGKITKALTFENNRAGRTVGTIYEG